MYSRFGRGESRGEVTWHSYSHRIKASLAATTPVAQYKLTSSSLFEDASLQEKGGERGSSHRECGHVYVYMCDMTQNASITLDEVYVHVHVIHCQQLSVLCGYTIHCMWVVHTLILHAGYCSEGFSGTSRADFPPTYYHLQNRVEALLIFELDSLVFLGAKVTFTLRIGQTSLAALFRSGSSEPPQS